MRMSTELCIFVLVLHLSCMKCVINILHSLSSTIVDIFPDAMSDFGPQYFHFNGYLERARPSNGCHSMIMRQSKFILFNNRKLSADDSIPSLTPTSTFYDKPKRIALIESGSCDFDEKVFNAQQAGYSAAIVYNIDGSSIFPMNGNRVEDKITIPSVMVSNNSGFKLIQFANNENYVAEMISFYAFHLKYVLYTLLILVAISLFVLLIMFLFHMLRLWCRLRRRTMPYRLLKRLPTKRFVKGIDRFETCSICLEDYMDRDKLRVLPCQHVFHIKCIDPWLLPNRRRCPVCNRIVPIRGAPLMPEEVSEQQQSVFLRHVTNLINAVIGSDQASPERSAVSRRTDYSRSLSDIDDSENRQLLLPPSPQMSTVYENDYLHGGVPLNHSDDDGSLSNYYNQNSTTAYVDCAAMDMDLREVYRTTQSTRQPPVDESDDYLLNLNVDSKVAKQMQLELCSELFETDKSRGHCQLGDNIASTSVDQSSIARQEPVVEGRPDRDGDDDLPLICDVNVFKEQ